MRGYQRRKHERITEAQIPGWKRAVHAAQVWSEG